MDDLNARIEDLLQQLSGLGLLNDQFQQLMLLEDDSNPTFVREVVELYFQDSAAKLDKLDKKLTTYPPEYAEVDALVHQFKGSSASFGAQALASLCVQMREACQKEDQGRCLALLGEANSTYSALKEKLEVFLQLDVERKRLLGQRC